MKIAIIADTHDNLATWKKVAAWLKEKVKKVPGTIILFSNPRNLLVKREKVSGPLF